MKVFTMLLLGHSHSVQLFGMFFRYRWCSLLLAVWWGLGIHHLQSGDIFNMNLASGDHSAADGTHSFVTWLEGAVVIIHGLFKRMGRVNGWVYNRNGILSPYKKTLAIRLLPSTIICHIVDVRYYGQGGVGGEKVRV